MWEQSSRFFNQVIQVEAADSSSRIFQQQQSRSFSFFAVAAND
jgi:hypothetical protein